MNNEYNTRAPDQEKSLRDISRAIADTFPGGAGFALFIIDYGPDKNLVYLSNTSRQDMVRILQEFIARQA